MNITVDEVFEYLAKRGVVGGTPLLSEAKKKGVKKEKEGEASIPRPRIGITEAWGTPDSEAGHMIRKYAQKIEGSTIKEKIDNLNAYAFGGEARTIGEIMATIVLLECLSGLMTEFTASAGGFIFESFLAGLMFGAQTPLDDPGGIQIQDMVVSRSSDDGEKEYKSPYSIKLLTKTGGGVTGSNFLLYKGILKFGFMTYWVALKETDKSGIELYEFTITKKDMEEWLDEESFEKFMVRIVVGQNQAKWGPIAKELGFDGFVEMIKNEKMGRISLGTFKFNKTEYRNPGPMWLGTSKGSQGTLSVGEGTIREIAEQYAETLEGEFNVIYDSLEKLSNSVTDYFLNDDMAAGQEAQANAAVLKSETDRIVS